MKSKVEKSSHWRHVARAAYLTPLCKTRKSKSSTRHVTGFPCLSPLSKQENVLLCRTGKNKLDWLTLYPDKVILWRTGKNKLYWRCIMTTLYYYVSERTNYYDVVSWQRYNMTYRKELTLLTLYPDNVLLWRTGKNKLYWHCILTTLYYYVSERTNYYDAVSWQRYTTYHEERFLVTLYPDNVILCRTGKTKLLWRCILTTLYDVPRGTNSSDVVSRQSYTMTYRKEQAILTLYPDNAILLRIGKNTLLWRCILTTLYYDVPERTNSIDAVSRQRSTMTYRKELTLLTLYPDNAIILRIGKDKLLWRCILTTLHYDVPERTNSIDAVSWQRYTMTYRKELYRDNVVLWLHFVRQLLII